MNNEKFSRNLVLGCNLLNMNSLLTSLQGIRLNTATLGCYCGTINWGKDEIHSKMVKMQCALKVNVVLTFKFQKLYEFLLISTNSQHRSSRSAF